MGDFLGSQKLQLTAVKGDRLHQGPPPIAVLPKALASPPPRCRAEMMALKPGEDELIITNKEKLRLARILYKLGFGLHSARVGSIITAAQRGVPVEHISKLALHSSIDVTLSYLRESPYLSDLDKQSLKISEDLVSL